jgi:hypothetical protein
VLNLTAAPALCPAFALPDSVILIEKTSREATTSRSSDLSDAGKAPSGAFLFADGAVCCCSA